MSTLTTIQSTDKVGDSRTVINTNFSTLNTDKAEKSNVLELDNTDAFTPDADYEPATKKYVDDNAGGASDFDSLSDTPANKTGSALKVVRVNAGETALEYVTVSGTGDVVGPASATDGVPALFDGTTGKLLKNSTPTGTGNPVLASSPTLITPALGTPSALVGTNITGTAAGLTAGAVSTITGLAPDTATTQATQPNITSAANLATIGTVTSGTISTGAVIADPTMTLGSDADGDIYYRSSNKLTRLAKGTANQRLKMNSGATAPEWTDEILTLTFVIDGGGSAITTGIKGDLEIPFACTIQQVTALADQSGSIVVDIWKDTYANYPPTDADSITASAPPTITTATKSQDATLTGWTTSIAAGDTLRFNVDSITTIERVTISLKVKKT